jgi:hypothetical protein
MVAPFQTLRTCAVGQLRDRRHHRQDEYTRRDRRASQLRDLRYDVTGAITAVFGTCTPIPTTRDRPARG